MRTNRLEAAGYDALRAEVRESPQARRQHRIHAVLLVAGGLSCRAAARCLGDSPRAVEYWVKRYNDRKIIGLSDSAPPGRPSRLSMAQLTELRAALSAAAPRGARRWTGAQASALIARRWGVVLGVRQAQRLLARFEAS